MRKMSTYTQACVMLIAFSESAISLFSFSTAFYIMGGTSCLKYLKLSFLPYFQSLSVFSGIFPKLEDITFVCQNEGKQIKYPSVLMMEHF